MLSRRSPQLGRGLLPHLREKAALQHFTSEAADQYLERVRPRFQFGKPVLLRCSAGLPLFVSRAATITRGRLAGRVQSHAAGGEAGSTLRLAGPAATLRLGG